MRKVDQLNNYYAGLIDQSSNDEYLEHYGVKGMKWQKRKKVTTEYPEEYYKYMPSYGTQGYHDAQVHNQKHQAKIKAYNRQVPKHNINEIKKAAADDFSRMRKTAKKLKTKLKTKLRHADYDDPEQFQRDLEVLDQIIYNVEAMDESELASAYAALGRCECYVSDFNDE